MPDGSSNIIHFNAVRVRMVGVGNMKLQLQGYDNVELQDLISIPMTTTKAREVTVPANFIVQYGKLKMYTTEKDEVMRVNSIILFVKEMWSDFPINPATGLS